MISGNIPRKSLFILLLINIALAFYATPIIDCGDTISYIELSKKFLGENISVNMAHRSPLFSIIMALVIKIFSIPLAYKVMIYIQFGLVFVTSVMIFSLFKRIFKNQSISVLIAVLFNLSISTIYYANILLTEILTIFLLFVSLHYLMKYFDHKKLKYLIILGLSIGLLSLARFNAVPLVLTFLLLLTYMVFVEQRKNFKKGIVPLIVFLIPYMVIFNAWCFYNYYHNGFYGIFPGGGALATRNVIVASIRPDNKVEPVYQPVLDIFIKAKEVDANKKKITIKGSFSSNDTYGILDGLYSGYHIYAIAYPELIKYYGLKETDGEYQMNHKLSGFYKEIARENMAFIWKLRVYSLLSGFRASSSGILPAEFGNINLNILPAFVIKLYKAFTFFVSSFVFFAFFFFIYKLIKQHSHKPDFLLLVLFMIVFSFWGINFLFATESNANRFKFPAEPLIIGLFIYYLRELVQWFIKFRRPVTNT